MATHPTTPLVPSRVHRDSALQKPSLALFLLSKERVLILNLCSPPSAWATTSHLFRQRRRHHSRRSGPYDRYWGGEGGRLISSIHESRNQTKTSPMAAVGTWNPNAGRSLRTTRRRVTRSLGFSSQTWRGWPGLQLALFWVTLVG